jgi:hypothetical protein
MKNLVDVSAWTANVRSLQDAADYINELNLGTTAQDLANRTKYLKDAVEAEAITRAADDTTEIGLRTAADTALRAGIPGQAASYRVEQPLTPILLSEAAAWVAKPGAFWLQADVSTAQQIVFPLLLPAAGTLSSVVAIIDGRDGTFGSAHAAKPGTMPIITVSRRAPGSGANVPAAVEVGVGLDSSATVAAYELVHGLAAAALAHAIDPDSVYWVTLSGEAGANAQANSLAVYRLYAIVTP